MKATFNGCEPVGCVRLDDGLIQSVARFNTDDEAKLFYGMLIELLDENLTTKRKLEALRDAVNHAAVEANRT